MLLSTLCTELYTSLFSSVRNYSKKSAFKAPKVSLLCVLMLGFLFAKDVAKKQDAILLVAFGTTSENGRKAYDCIENDVRRNFPDEKILWAYTSEIVRKRLYKKSGKKVFSVTEALQSLASSNISQVTVQSLHVVPGEEFEELTRLVRQYEILNPKSFGAIEIGRPLLCSKKDMEHVVHAVTNEFQNKQKTDEGLILLGHGHHHGVGDLSYLATAEAFKKRNSLTVLSTVEGGLTLDGVMETYKSTGVKTVWLAPFMVVAGVHTVEDLVGEKESVKSQFESNGFTCKSLVKGLGEYAQISALFVQHIRNAMEK